MAEMKVRIGFIPAHRELFDEEWAKDLRKRTLSVLCQIKNLEIIVPDEQLTKGGLVRDDEDAEKVIGLFKERDIAGMIIGTLTFGDEVSVISIAEVFPNCPILLFGTKEGPFTPEGGRRSDAFCGTLSISSGLRKRRIPFVFGAICFPEEEVFRRRIEAFIKTCAIVEGFRGSRIGLVGPRPERFETCAFNEVAMMKAFRQRVVHISLTDVLTTASNLGDEDPRVQEILQRMKKQADTTNVKEESLRKIAKLELALRKFAEDKKLAGIGVQCWDEMERVYGVVPCFVMGRLTDQGIMMACEVDIYGALTMLIQYLASLNSSSPHFIDWTIQHQEKENVFLAWHCGNAPPSLALEGCPIQMRSTLLEKVLGPELCKGTGEFQLKAGPVTICRLDYDEKFKLLITKGQIETYAEELRGSWSWVKVRDLLSLYESLIDEGFIHHASLIHGDYVEAIADACKFLNIEAVIV